MILKFKNRLKGKRLTLSGYKYEGKLREDTFSEHFNDFRNTLVFSKLRSEYKKK